jgi:hypothetical protein
VNDQKLIYEAYKEGLLKNIDNIEKIYIYTDDRTPERKEVFRYQGKDILKADEELLKATGINVVKSPWLGCSIHILKTKENE